MSQRTAPAPSAPTDAGPRLRAAYGPPPEAGRGRHRPAGLPPGYGLAGRPA